MLPFEKLCDVVEAAVIADTSGTPTLAAYVAADPDARTPAVADLRTRLHRDLPPYMVPAHIVVLSALPRGDRGKVDRTALPQVGRPEFDPPRGEHETSIATLWAEALHVEKVGRTDGFYALGGDSLTVTQMLTSVYQTHRVKLNPSDLASAPTVAEFARKLAGSDGAAALPPIVTLLAVTRPPFSTVSVPWPPWPTASVRRLSSSHCDPCPVTVTAPVPPEPMLASPPSVTTDAASAMVRLP